MKACPICQQKEVIFERTIFNFKLVKCYRCDFVYADLDDKTIEKANMNYGDEDAHGFENYQTFIDELWFRRIAARFTRRFGEGRVLDVGCGNGLLLSQFKELGWVCYGVDLSPWSKTYAEKYGFTLFQGKAEDISSNVRGFDLIVSSSTLEHIAQPLPHAQAILSLLNSNGIAYFCGIPNYGSIFIKLGASDFRGNRPPRHVNYFTHRSLLRLLYFASEVPHKVKVRSYGLPEVHKIYRRVTRIVRSKKHPQALVLINGNNTASQNRNEVRDIAIRRITGRFFESAFYLSGRIGNFGDKLEARVVRTC